MSVIVVTSDKGGVGKSTVSVLLMEWLNYREKKPLLIDADPIQTAQTWVDNCCADGRIVSHSGSSLKVVDTAGTSGAGLTWLKQADLVLAPFQPHYADLRTIMDWFLSLNRRYQGKVVFIPNRFQRTKEQQEGLSQVKETLEKEGVGYLLDPLSNRPAIFAPLLNGSATNFFEDLTDKVAFSEAKTAMEKIEHILKELENA